MMCGVLQKHIGACVPHIMCMCVCKGVSIQLRHVCACASTGSCVSVGTGCARACDAHASCRNTHGCEAIACLRACVLWNALCTRTRSASNRCVCDHVHVHMHEPSLMSACTGFVRACGVRVWCARVVRACLTGTHTGLPVTRMCVCQRVIYPAQPCVRMCMYKCTRECLHCTWLCACL